MELIDSNTTVRLLSNGFWCLVQNICMDEYEKDLSAVPMSDLEQWCMYTLQYTYLETGLLSSLIAFW